MSKKVLVISSSYRKGGNSDQLADSFAEGARSAGHEVEKISLKDKQINFCRGCLACQKTLKCVMKDDAGEIIEKIKNSEVIAFASPIYYYEMCGQLKTLLDRCNPIFPAEYEFRDIYFLAACADTEQSAMDYAIGGIQGWIACFENSSLKGVVRATGVTEIGDIKGNSALRDAYEAGRKI